MKRCIAKNSKGNRCGNKARVGKTTCSAHRKYKIPFLKWLLACFSFWVKIVGVVITFIGLPIALFQSLQTIDILTPNNKQFADIKEARMPVKNRNPFFDLNNIQFNCTNVVIVDEFQRKHRIGIDLMGSRDELGRLSLLEAGGESVTICPISYPFGFHSGTSFTIEVTYKWFFGNGSKRFDFVAASDGDSLVWLRTIGDL